MTAVGLFTNDDLFADRFAGLEGRLAQVRERYDTYHTDCSRRYVADESRSARDRLDGARKYLAGEYDRTYTSGLGFATVEDWRANYADDALQAAEHHLVWAEYYAGLRTRDDAQAADPYRRNR
jgi:hypothetical protein